MITLDDLGLQPEAITESDGTGGKPLAPTPRPLALTPTSPLARALYEVWVGRPITVLKAAPGSGKSTLISRLVALLLMRTNLKVTVLAPTRNSAFDLAERIGQVLAEECGTRDKYASVLGLRGTEFEPVHAVKTGDGSERSVMVRTVASASSIKAPASGDVTIIDEAYQATLSDVAVALRDVDQMVLVGDPGQIGPVITVDDRAWAKQATRPTRRAPELMLERPDTALIELNETYRLGAATTALLGILYDFSLISARFARSVTHDPRVDSPDLKEIGGGLPEIVRLRLPDVDDRSEASYVRRVAETALSYVGRSIDLTTPDGEQSSHTLVASDICVVAAYRTQVSRLTAILDSYDAGRFACGTVDALQGGQWHVVVAVDPLVGSETAEGHNASTGRLCVMLSRHMTHLVWAHDGRWEEVLANTPPAEPSLPTSRAVRSALNSFPKLG